MKSNLLKDYEIEIQNSLHSLANFYSNYEEEVKATITAMKYQIHVLEENNEILLKLVDYMERTTK